MAQADAHAELGRHREARAGSLDVGDASKLANVLQILGRMIEGSELETRIEALEKGGPGAGSGRGRP